MGVLQRFERRIEGLVEGTFARVFKGVVEPVEVASALQREAEDRKTIVSRDRVLVPNEYVVELGESDTERLRPYSAPLTDELAAMLREHAEEQGWSFVGPVRVHLDQVDDLDTGVFRVRSAVSQGEGGGGQSGSGGQSSDQDGDQSHEEGRRQIGTASEQASMLGLPDGQSIVPVPPDGSGRPRLVLSSGEEVEAWSPAAQLIDEEYVLREAVTVIGRAKDTDLVLTDTGVSRRHAEVRFTPTDVVLRDLGSTNGTTVNGRRVELVALHDGDRIEVGHTELIYRRDER
ncbi:MAG TPA: DUF3662 and FHA domain-containing protein [Nocardioidaceae bacterium]|nr:DUF3662 and FHA domain-containing protein [Nocardioidaceae bacterium]